MAGPLHEATRTEALPLPEWMTLDGDRQKVVTEHRVDVDPRWWSRSLSAVPVFEGEAPVGESLTRGDLFALGGYAGSSVKAARELLWATLSWGTGRRQRLNRKRIEGVAARADEGALLREVAERAREGPGAAYTLMRPGRRNAVPYLGPPFFTKFLYFAGGGSPDHGCLILDSVVAEVLQNECGWASLRGRTWWPTATYVRYCSLMQSWASQLAERERRPVAADEVERVLFGRGRRRESITA